jgi:hypothetical protein
LPKGKHFASSGRQALPGRTKKLLQQAVTSIPARGCGRIPFEGVATSQQLSSTKKQNDRIPILISKKQTKFTARTFSTFHAG